MSENRKPNTENPSPSGGNLLKPLLLVALALAVPVVPFLLLGEGFEEQMRGWVDESASRPALAAMVAGVLAADILLPVPSSVVSTIAGRALGFWTATAASWLGMTVGCTLAFGLVRRFGRPLAVRLAGEEALERTDRLAARHGTLVLALTRPVPVLAEASVVLFGATRLAWRPFLAVVGLANLAIAAAYAALGEHAALPWALAASVAIPAAAALAARRWWPATPRP